METGVEFLGKTEPDEVVRCRRRPCPGTHAAKGREVPEDRARRRLKLEQRTDLLISTLRNCVESMGELHLVAEFPDRPPVELAGFAAMENERRKKDQEAHD
jgi:hypothetical protein